MPNANSPMADAILAALLSTATISDAARAVGVARSTVYSYLKDPAFAERLEAERHKLQSRIADSVAEKAAKSVGAAIDTLTNYALGDYGFMQSSDDQLKASEIIMRTYGGGVMRDMIRRNSEQGRSGTD